jgi:hypothetical protein
MCRAIDAGRIAASEDDLGGSGSLCRSAKFGVVVGRCRAMGARKKRAASPRFGERC